MITVTKEPGAGKLTVRLSGALDEEVDFSQLFGKFDGVLVVNCKQVHRLNSAGVKAWVNYFTELTQRKQTFSFEEVSPVLVEQFNMISNFGGGGHVTSIQVPYFCSPCKTAMVATLQSQSIKENKLEPPELKCPKCGGVVKFDDIPEEYFGFLKG